MTAILLNGLKTEGRQQSAGQTGSLTLCETSPTQPDYTTDQHREPDMAKKLTDSDNDVEKIVDKKTVKDIVFDVDNISAESSKLLGDKSAIFTRAEKAGVNKPALKDIIKINNMEDGARADYLAAFDLYREYLDLDTYDQGDMLNVSNDKAA